MNSPISLAKGGGLAVKVAAGAVVFALAFSAMPANAEAPEQAPTPAPTADVANPAPEVTAPPELPKSNDTPTNVAPKPIENTAPNAPSSSAKLSSEVPGLVAESMGQEVADPDAAAKAPQPVVVDKPGKVLRYSDNWQRATRMNVWQGEDALITGNYSVVDHRGISIGWPMTLQKLAPKPVGKGFMGTEWVDVRTENTAANGDFKFAIPFSANSEVKYRVWTNSPSTGEVEFTQEYTLTDLFQKLNLRWEGSITQNGFTEHSTGVRFRGTAAIDRIGEARDRRGEGDLVFSVTYDGITKELNRIPVRMQEWNRSYSFSHVDRNFFPKSGKATYSVTFQHKTAADKNYVDGGTLNASIPFSKVGTSVTSSGLTGSAMTVSLGKPVPVSGTITGGDRRIEMQRYDATKKVWVTYSYLNVTSPNTTPAKFNFNIPVGHVTASWRLYSPATTYYGEFVGKTTVVNRPAEKSSITLGSWYTKKTVPWVQRQLEFYVNNAIGKPVGTVTLQKYDSKKKAWVNVSTVKVTSWTVKVNLPKGSTASANSTTSYRGLYYAGQYYANVGSAGASVTWENPNKYTGERLQYYNYMKAYCPAVTLQMGNLGGPWGLAYLSGYYETNIRIQTGIPGNYRQTVANHECAHFRQWLAAGQDFGKYKKLEARLNQIYGTRGSVGIERNADCIASLMSRMSYWAYGDACSAAAKKNAAKAVLAGRWP